MIVWAILAAAVFIGAAAGLAVALSGFTEGFEERLDDLAWTIKRH